MIGALLLCGAAFGQSNLSITPSSLYFSFAPNDAPADRTLTVKNLTTQSLTTAIMTRQAQAAAAANVTAANTVLSQSVNVAAVYDKKNYSAPFAEDRVLIVYKDQPGVSATAASVSTAGVVSTRELARARHPKTGLRGLSGRTFMLAKLKSKGRDAVLQAIDILKKDPNVLYVQPDYRVHAYDIPNDPGFAQQYHLNNTGQTGGTVDADIDAPEAWAVQKTAKKVIIGIIDTGIDYLHPDLIDNIWTNPNEIPGNGIDDDNNGYIDDVHGWDFANDDNDPMDDFFHGTHCAGIVAAKGNNGVGVCGVAWEASLMALKFLDNTGYGYDSDAIDAINYAAAMGAKVLSNSWGGSSFDQALEDAIAASNTVFVVAAGNYGSDLEANPEYPACYPLDNVICVASTDNNDALSTWNGSGSNYGAVSVDLAAPGSSIYSTTPRLQNRTMASYNISPMYAYLSGTSMATPIVSGVAALMLEKNGSLTPLQVKNILLTNVDHLSSLDGKCVSGGRVNAYQALKNTTVQWLTLDQSSLSLAAGQSKNVKVTASAKGMNAGRWDCEIVFTPSAGSEAVVPVEMDVGASRMIDVQPRTVDFGTVYTGFESKKTVAVRNTGNSLLTVQSVQSDNKAFSVQGTFPLTVAPFAGRNILLVFKSQTAGTISGTATIASDAQNEPAAVINLTGFALQPPVIAVSPVALTAAAAVGQTASATFKISNNGNSNLNVTMAPLLPADSWLSLGAGAAIIAAGASVDVPVTMDAKNLLGDAYRGFISITHNDPVRASPIYLPATFTVTGERRLTVTPSQLTFKDQQGGPFDFTTKTINSSISGLGCIAAADMDNDGDLDIVAGTGSFPEQPIPYVCWLENKKNGSGIYVKHMVYQQQLPNIDPNWFYNNIQAVDFDNDGDMDIVAMVFSGTETRIILFENLGGNNFAMHQLASLSGGYTAMNVFDADKDGDPDILIASRYKNSIVLLENKGAMTLAEHVISTDALYVQTIDHGDLDGDGDEDIVASEYDNGEIAWYENQGQFVYKRHTADVLNSANSAYLIDFDHDGDLDIVGSSYRQGDIHWCENNGKGVFTPHVVFAGVYGETYADFCMAGDMDLDGDNDIVASINTVVGGNTQLLWFENDGSNNFPQTHVINDKYGDLYPILVDFDKDGDLDMLAGTYDYPADLPFEVVRLYESGRATTSGLVHLVNNGTEKTTITALSIDNARFTHASCLPLSVFAKDSADILVTYHKGNGSAASGTLVITGNAVDNPQFSVRLDGPPPIGIPIPGRIQAEDYKAGGEGVGYHDLTAGNTGGAYRKDGVDIQVTTDVGGGYNVGWIDAGEWLAFDVNAADDGPYAFTARVASGATGQKTLTVSIDNTITRTFTFTTNNGWQGWFDVTAPAVFLTAGAHSLRMTMTTAGFNLNYLDAAKAHTITATAGPNGAIAPAGSVTVAHNANQTFIITPLSGYKVDKVMVDGVDQGPVTTYTFTAVTADHAIGATFKQSTDVLIKQAVTGSTASSGTPGLAHDGNTGTRWESAQKVDPQWIAFDLGSPKPITVMVIDWEAANAKNYQIEGSNDATFASKTVLKTLTNMPTGNHRIDSLTGLTGSYRYYRMYGTARNLDYGYSIWETRFYSGGSMYTLSTTVTGIGSVSLNPAGGTYASGTVVTLSASTSEPGYKFDKWSGDLTGSANPATVTMNSNKSITAAFANVGTYVVIASAGANGSISPQGTVPVTLGFAKTFMISASSGYAIADVLVDGTNQGAVASYTFPSTTTGTHTIVASFKPGAPVKLPISSATASSVENAGTPASAAIDGNLTTRWSSQFSDPQWICVDLGGAKSIAEVKLIWEAASGMNYTLEGSNDPTFASKTVLAAKTNMPKGPRTDDLTGLSGSFRYIRMNGTVRNTGWGYSLYEFEVYGN
jgi:subtilisin family serine protease